MEPFWCSKDDSRKDPSKRSIARVRVQVRMQIRALVSITRHSSWRCILVSRRQMQHRCRRISIISSVILLKDDDEENPLNRNHYDQTRSNPVVFGHAVLYWSLLHACMLILSTVPVTLSDALLWLVIRRSANSMVYVHIFFALLQKRNILYGTKHDSK